MKIANLEKETIILFNEQEQTARIETFNGRLLRQLRKADEASENVTCEESQEGYGVYTLPKALVKIHVPRKLSLEERQLIGQQLKASREKAIQNQF